MAKDWRATRRIKSGLGRFARQSAAGFPPEARGAWHPSSRLGSSASAPSLKAAAVDAGRGSAAEFAAVDVRGKVAVVTRSNEVSAHERAVNALAAGATLLLVVNDEPGELSEWVGGDDYMPEVGMPVAAVGGAMRRSG